MKVAGSLPCQPPCSAVHFLVACPGALPLPSVDAPRCQHPHAAVSPGGAAACFGSALQASAAAHDTRQMGAWARKGGTAEMRGRQLQGWVGGVGRQKAQMAMPSQQAGCKVWVKGNSKCSVQQPGDQLAVHTLAGLVWLPHRQHCPKVEGSKSLTWIALQTVV